MKTAISIIFLVLAAISPVFAGNTAEVYKSGILVSVFVGISALIVVVQLVPALIMILEFIKSLMSEHRKENTIAKSTPKGN